MLSLDRCRQILGSDCPLSDEELEALRRALYGLADVAITMHLERAGQEPRRRDRRDAH